jgi:hypothetical protein
MTSSISENSCDWQFVEELKQPLKRYFHWSRAAAKPGEADLSRGVRIIAKFPDTDTRLATAYEDTERFFIQAGISLGGGYKIITESGKAGPHDSFRLRITSDSCRISAANTEGIRRGLFQLQDMLLAADGPFLESGEIRREAWLKNRISRCFFGPIKRPPLNRDELLDEVDYYPEEYLNRLAHEGVNGLWLTVKFSDLCKTRISPEFGPEAEKRLAKLRSTVDKCLRYGIKTYLFCIEPAAWNADSPVLERHPELGGARNGNTVFFCPFSTAAQEYLYEAVNGIFKAVPGLGGMINISHGERATSCLSSISATDQYDVNCPVCSRKKAWEILAALLSPMEKGMHDAAPAAELISWLYMPQAEKLADWVYEIPEHIPENVILQFNFESGGGKEQLGKIRRGGDYWLSYVGPSERFANIAEAAGASGTGMAAKIQVGCSHEVATVPFVPVPALLYRKYREMRRLGVSSVMQCWYFGNYPGLMNKAAGMLGFEDFTSSENEFLKELALPEWGIHAEKTVKAWSLFAEAYNNYPMSNMFQYYGPMHDGVVWPLYLYPVRLPLAPTWKLEFGISGDCIGECLKEHTIDEAIILCGRMAERWNEGVRILQEISPDFAADPERLKDIALAEALGIQFTSGHNILRFYALREQLFNAKGNEKLIEEMETIVYGEISRSKRLKELCEKDSRLGFHSEAEGYKYSPDKLEARVKSLTWLLKNDFSKLKNAVKMPEKAEFPVYNCGSGKFEQCETFRWKAELDEELLRFQIQCRNIDTTEQLESFFITLASDNVSPPLYLEIIQKSFLYPKYPGCSCKVSHLPDEWRAEITIPLTILDTSAKSLKTSIIRQVDENYFAWEEISTEPRYRLDLGIYNPANMGKLILE